MFKSVVYEGSKLVGEVEVYPSDNDNSSSYSYILRSKKEIRISHFSKPSERCSPLSVLHTISPSGGFCFKLQSVAAPAADDVDDDDNGGDDDDDSVTAFNSLHSSCLRDNKTAIMQLGEEELHLVAMQSRNNSELYSHFWCFIVSMGLYDSCLIMLNLRCLGIVFDLDETLVVANTMRSFEDRIEALQRKISTEMDTQRVDGMLAEIRRYHEDKAILKQYLENDQVVEDQLVFKSQVEVFPALSDNHQQVARPLIRLPEKNIILTRINPMIRDTSILVRLRPAWEDLRTYLTAKGRKRFEVYVCTMAEKDYALEMWRLLDPGLNLISSNKLLDRIVCVNAGLKKSLLNVFHDGICHPKMALVIDDRLKVWDDKDQSRVHVVPPFVPYYAPQAEVNNTVPVLCVARNVACNVRGGFFKDFDDGLLQKLSDVFYEDEVPDIASPDVGNYLLSEDDASGLNKDPLRFEGMSDVEVERRLKESVPGPVLVNNLDGRLAPLQLTMATSSSIASQPLSERPVMGFSQDDSLVKPLLNVGPSQTSLQSSPGREEGELPESELDQDMRRRMLIMQHGQDRRDYLSKDAPLPVTTPVQTSPAPAPVPAAAPVQPHRGWSPLEEEMNTRHLNQAVPKPLAKKAPLESASMRFSDNRPSQTSYFHGMEDSVNSDAGRFGNRKFFKEARRGDHRLRSKHQFLNYRSLSEESSLGPMVKNIKDSHFENGQDTRIHAENPVEVLQNIANKCRYKVELRPVLIDSIDLQFSVEVWLAGEKIGVGNGRTRKEAQRQAAERSISALANYHLSNVFPDPNFGSEKLNKLSQNNESDVFEDPPFFGRGRDSSSPVPYTSEPSRFLDPRVEGPKKAMDSVSALKQICFKEGLALMIKGQPTLTLNSVQKEEEQAQVEIGGKILGKGTAPTWEEAKIQAAEEALGNLNTMLGIQKRPDPPQSFQAFPSKRMRPESSRVFQRFPSARYS